MDDFIRIRGAREHNLRSIDLDLPRNELANDYSRIIPSAPPDENPHRL